MKARGGVRMEPRRSVGLGSIPTPRWVRWSPRSSSTACAVISSPATGRRQGRAGGDRLSGKGYFVEPTVRVDTKPDMKVTREEIFGPVVVVIPFKEEDDDLFQARMIRPTAWPPQSGRVTSAGPNPVRENEGRRRVGQLLHHHRCDIAVRRLQAIGLRTGNGKGRPGSLHPDKLVYAKI